MAHTETERGWGGWGRGAELSWMFKYTECFDTLLTCYNLKENTIHSIFFLFLNKTQENIEHDFAWDWELTVPGCQFLPSHGLVATTGDKSTLKTFPACCHLHIQPHSHICLSSQPLRSKGHYVRILPSQSPQNYSTRCQSEQTPRWVPAYSTNGHLSSA